MSAFRTQNLAGRKVWPVLLGGQWESSDIGSAWAPGITLGRDKNDLRKWDWLTWSDWPQTPELTVSAPGKGWSMEDAG